MHRETEEVHICGQEGTRKPRAPTTGNSHGSTQWATGDYLHVKSMGALSQSNEGHQAEKLWGTQPIKTTTTTT